MTEVVKPLTASELDAAKLYAEGLGDGEEMDLSRGFVLRLLSMARQSLAEPAGWRTALTGLAALTELVDPKEGPDRVKVEGIWYDGPLAASYHKLLHGVAAVAKEALTTPAVTSPPKGEEEPVAWAKPEGLEYIKNGPKGCVDFITAETTKNYTTPLFTRPNPVSAELVEAAKSALRELELDLGTEDDPHKLNTANRLRAALSAHAGGTV